MNDTIVHGEEGDPIRPVEIRHDVDEIVFDGETEQLYNYLDYRFEGPKVHCRARTYLDDIDTVSVDGPFAGSDSEDEVDAPEFFDNVLSYLKRRFMMIDAAGEDGYETIWKHPDLK